MDSLVHNVPLIELWLCDDDDMILRALDRALVRPLVQSGVISRSMAFPDAKYLWEAYEVLPADVRSFRIILSDLEMPIMKGSELVLNILRLNATAEIFIMTGAIDSVSTPILEPCMALGWDIESRRFRKPFEVKDLITAVEMATKSIKRQTNTSQEQS